MNNLKIGRLGWLGVAIETNPGAPLPPVDYIPFLDCTLQEMHEPIAQLSALAIRDRQGENSQIGKVYGDGKLSVNLDATLAPKILGLALGVFGTPADQGSGVYLHTLTRNNSNTPLTASITYNRATIDQQIFPYSVVDSVDISFSDGLAVLDANIVSRNPVTTASGTMTVTSGTLFTFRNAQIQMGSTLTLASSATPLRVKEFKMTIKNNAEKVYVVGNNDVADIAVKDFEVVGTVSLYFEDTTQRDYFRNLSKNAMIITLTGASIGGGLNEFVKFRIAKVRYDKFSPSVKIDDIATQGLEFVAEYSSADSKTIDIQVQNRKSAYT